MHQPHFNLDTISQHQVMKTKFLSDPEMKFEVIRDGQIEKSNLFNWESVTGESNSTNKEKHESDPKSRAPRDSHG